MIQKAIDKLLRRRHYWRTIEFNELSELYTTQFLRSLSISLAGIFVPIYLYKIGYTITEISLFFVVWFAVRPLFTYYTAQIIGRIGPKHAMVTSVGFQIIYLSLILTLEHMNWSLYLIALVGSLYYGLYRMAFDVDFSKVKHNEHGGKEVGYMQIFERIGGVIGPLIGGLIAGFYDPRYTLLLSIAVMLLSLIPLLSTAETVTRRQVVIFKGFPARRYRWSIVLSGIYQILEVCSVIIWPLFLGAFVLLEGTYQAIGLLASLSTVLAIISSYIIGRSIDKKHGRKLFNLGIYINTLVLILKPFVGGIMGALAVNLVREPAASAYKIPFMKSRYDEADSVVGYRIVYFAYVELAIAVANVALWGFIALFSYYINDKLALQLSFIIGSLLGLILLRQKFAALRQ